MKYMLSCIVLLTLLGTVARADVVKLRGGITIVNCLVTDTTDNRITVQTTQQVRRYILQLVDEVLKSPYDPGRETEYFEAGAKVTPQPGVPVPVTPATPIQPGQTIIQETRYPNLVLLPLSVVSLVLAIDYISTASDYTDQIEVYRKLNEIYGREVFDTSKLESVRTRKTVVAVALLAGAVVNTIFALKTEKVTLRVSATGFNLRYEL